MQTSVTPNNGIDITIVALHCLLSLTGRVVLGASVCGLVLRKTSQFYVRKHDDQIDDPQGIAPI